MIEKTPIRNNNFFKVPINASSDVQECWTNIWRTLDKFHDRQSWKKNVNQMYWFALAEILKFSKKKKNRKIAIYLLDCQGMNIQV